MGRTVQRVLEATIEAARLLTTCTYKTLAPADLHDASSPLRPAVGPDTFRGRADGSNGRLRDDASGLDIP